MKKKLQRMNQGSNFLSDSFDSSDIVRNPIQIGNEIQFYYFSSRTDPLTYILIAFKLLKQWDETNRAFLVLKLTHHFFPQTV